MYTPWVDHTPIALLVGILLGGAVALPMGLALGALLVRRQDALQREALSKALLDALAKQAPSGGPCWVKAQLPPHAHE